MPRQLSGGQRQRVAMGRAIVRDPKVFLFDEPLSNLDAKLRVQMRTEIKRLRERVATTTIYVTHDQVEAMTLADRIVILNHGRIEQIGTPGGGLRHARDGVRRRLHRRAADEPAAGRGIAGPQRSARRAGGRAARASDLAPSSLPGAPFLSGRATVVEPLGSDTLVSLDVAGTAVIARLAPRLVRKAGEKVALSADPANIHFFDRATGARL